MKKNGLVFILCIGATISLFGGCATTPKSSVENGLYINSTCQFSIRIPDGWSVSDNMADSLRNKSPSNIKHTIQTAFSAPDGKSKIFVSAEKTRAHWSDFKMLSDQMIKKFEQDPIPSHDKDKFRTSFIDISTFRDQIDSCSGHCKAQTGTLIVETKDKLKLKLTICFIIYETGDEMFSWAYIMLMAGEKRHDADLGIFNATIDSFQSR